ncbi:hypothetical protein CL620_04435 [archaeon]|nr:hypothetical protein [archaeon]
MAEGEIIIYAVIGFGAGLYFFFKGFSLWRRKKLIENIPTSKVRSIAMGLVEVFGKAVKGTKLLESPFSLAKCVYYSYLVEEYRKQGKHSRWVTIRKDQSGIPFYLKDDTGKVLVDPIGADVDIPSDNVYKSNFGMDPPSAVLGFMKQNKLSHESWFFKVNKKMRYTEFYLAPKDEVYVIGTATQKSPGGTMNVDNIVITKGTNDTLFYITDEDESTIIKRFNKGIGLRIVGGALLALVCLVVIIAWFGGF